MLRLRGHMSLTVGSLNSNFHFDSPNATRSIDRGAFLCKVSDGIARRCSRPCRFRLQRVHNAPKDPFPWERPWTLVPAYPTVVIEIGSALRSPYPFAFGRSPTIQYPLNSLLASAQPLPRGSSRRAVVIDRVNASVGLQRRIQKLSRFGKCCPPLGRVNKEMAAPREPV